MYRSFSSSGEVVDYQYQQMSPEEITKMLEFVKKYVEPEYSETAKKIFEGVDGRKVTTDLEQLLHPGPELRPEKFNK